MNLKFNRTLPLGKSNTHASLKIGCLDASSHVLAVLTCVCLSSAACGAPPQITNKSIGWVSLWGMVYTYLPGVLVCWWQLFARRPVVRLPYWMKAWVDARKQLGLLSLFTSECLLLL